MVQRMDIKLPAIIAVAGAVFGYLVLSPFAMEISHIVHVDITAHEMSVWDVFRPEFLLWSLSFTLFGGAIGLAIGLLYHRVRKSAEEIREAKEYTDLVLDSMSDGMVTIGRDYRIISANRAFLETSGLSMNQVIGKHCYEVTHGTEEPCNTSEHLCPLKEILETGRPATAVHTHFDKDGNEIYVELTASPVKDNKGNVVQMLELTRDITERKKAEEELRQLNEELEQRVEERTLELKEVQEQLIQRERLAAVGQLAGSVGHDLRNPLGVIGNSAYYLKMKLKDKDVDEKVRKHLGIIQREVERSNKIISDLLDFSRARMPSLKEGDVNNVVEETLADIDVPETIAVETQLHAELPKILLDSSQIQQVFQNIVYNAVQAMPEGGKLEIKTGTKEDFVEAIFKDTGEGIPEEDIQRIFEPLFTTRVRGIGLGLAIVKGIVDGHEGSIEVKSEAGEGTTFTVKLPLQGD